MDKLVWCDIESTGKDPQTDQILEIALAVTDTSLSLIDHYTAVIRPFGDLVLSLEVAQMHSKTGLLEELADGKELSEVQLECIDFLEKHFESGPGINVGEITGASVHFDRNFLKHWMPMLHDCFHYRNFDISTLKKAYKIWVSDEPLFVPPVVLPENKAAVKTAWNNPHRALYDIVVSIAEAKALRTKLNLTKLAVVPTAAAE